MMMRALVVSFVAGSLLLTNTAFALEQKMLFNVESISYGKNAAPYCSGICKEKYTDPPLDKVLAEGWRIISSSPKEALGSAPGGDSWQCMCIGTQYVLQKDDPAPPLKPEAPSQNEELLKKEYELLKKENDLLKQENENLKDKLKIKKKK